MNKYKILLYPKRIANRNIQPLCFHIWTLSAFFPYQSGATLTNWFYDLVIKYNIINSNIPKRLKIWVKLQMIRICPVYFYIFTNKLSSLLKDISLNLLIMFFFIPLAYFYFSILFFSFLCFLFCILKYDLIIEHHLFNFLFRHYLNYVF